MTNPNFKPEHMNATHADLKGNQGIGRYVFFPGSEGRARKIAETFFKDIKVKPHDRCHNLYTGTLVNGKQKVDVAAISSGMGTPSLDIIMNELLRLGVKRFIRVGTSGLLQPKFMKPGDFVIATGAVRDDGASKCYAPAEFPAIASPDMVVAAEKAAQELGYAKRTHVGLLHSKDSLYGREFAEEGPLLQHNRAYMQTMRDAGVLASEMEASMMFTLAGIYQHEQRMRGHSLKDCQIKTGVVCVVLGEGSDYGTAEALAKITQEVSEIAVHTILELAKQEAK
jgi:uridine phosphorylase